jgi:hypothetical protein
MGGSCVLLISGGFHEDLLPFNPSLLGDAFVVKIRHDFVKCAEYNFCDSISCTTS